jgi:hypothetical protein
MHSELYFVYGHTNVTANLPYFKDCGGFRSGDYTIHNNT